MNTRIDERTALIDANRREYGEGYGSLLFPTPSAAAAALARRDGLLRSVKERGAAASCAGTKIHTPPISPGCRLCVEGAWSCLFINNRCNCRCFYCPTSQDHIGEPGTNNLDFPDVADYLDYLERFGFGGVSMSGGEPLLTPEKTLAYLTAVRKRFGDSVHLWMYTNGTLVTRDLLLQLRDAGLNEIRFDIGAIGYRLEPLRLAAGIIEHVTVEIPAVPEDVPLMREKMVELVESGVRYLNLHQMRLTPYNYPALAPRGYTFVHGSKVTVLESELAALELMAHALESQLPLGVNYCSFVYKNRFQALAGRRRYAALVRKTGEEVTGNGYLRSLAVVGSPEQLQRQEEAFIEAGASRDLWERGRGRIAFSLELFEHLVPEGGEVRLRYAQATVQPTMSYRNPFVEIALNKRRKVVVERQGVSAEMALDREMVAGLGRLARGEDGGSLPATMNRWEVVTGGLQDYF